jgi:hypothetical protein
MLSHLPVRYAHTEARQHLPELHHCALELESTITVARPPEPSSSALALSAQLPFYVAVVDVTADEHFLSTVRTALHAAVAAMPAATLFGLITFSDTICVHLLGSTVPHVKLLPIPATGEPAVQLHHMVPLFRMLAPVGSGRGHIHVAIENVASRQSGASCPHERGVDATLRALVDSIVGMHGMTAARLLVFLRGPSNAGVGTCGRVPRERSSIGVQSNLDPIADAVPSVSYRSHAGDTLMLFSEETADPLESTACSRVTFFADLADQAAESGVALYLYVCSPEPNELVALRTLPARSGGVLSAYWSIDDCVLLEDVRSHLKKTVRQSLCLTATHLS